MDKTQTIRELAEEFNMILEAEGHVSFEMIASAIVLETIESQAFEPGEPVLVAPSATC